ncbi:hypothetical protein D3C86_424080 [compost metagenome]
MKRPEFESQSLPRTPLTGLAWEELAPFEVHSLYEPLMGAGSSLYEFKRQGLRVLGSEWLEGAYLGSKALNENNSIRLSEEQISRFTPEAAPNLAHHSRFAAWVERGFFDSNQAAWLGYWRDQLDATSPSTKGLVLVAVGWVMNNWLDRAETGQKPLPGGTALGFYMKRVNQWIWDNGQANQTMLGDSVQLARQVEADACYLYLPPPRVAIDMRDWLIEAWWQGGSVPDLKAFYDGNPFYGTVEDYQAAVSLLFDHLEQIPLWVVQYRSDELDPLWGETPAWLESRDRLIQPHAGLGVSTPGERLMLAKRKSS